LSPSKRTYTITNQKFQTLKAAEEFVRKQVESFDPDNSLWPELLERHPQREEKVGVGVKEFFKAKNEFNQQTLFIRRTDGSVIDFSWLTCIKGKNTTTRTNLLEAMCEAVDGQIQFFKRRSKEKHCAICGAELLGLSVDVDHKKPFLELAKEFLGSRDLTPVVFDDCRGTQRACFKEVDLDFQTAWETFHADNATLRLTCSPCNRSRRIQRVGNANLF
jgi:hypothetical protein